MGDNKPNYYAILPASVRYDNNLKPMEKLLFAEITALSNKEGYCYAKNKYFADLYNCSERIISSYISHLAELNYIVVCIDKNQYMSKRKIYTFLEK